MRKFSIMLIVMSFIVMFSSSSFAQYGLKWSYYVGSSPYTGAYGTDDLNPSSDYNGDSYPDIVVYKLNAGVYTYSVINGNTGSRLWSASSGDYILGVGNSDNDSYPEAILVNMSAGEYSNLRIVDGRTGAVEWASSATNPFNAFFVDVDNDGKDEIIFIDGNYIRCYEYTGSVSVDESEDNELPESFKLKQNYPNPFNPSTTIEFSLPSISNTTINIYNTLGQVVRTLVNDNLSAGDHVIEWDGKNNANNKTASGVYFYQLTTDSFTESKKMLLLK